METRDLLIAIGVVLVIVILWRKGVFDYRAEGFSANVISAEQRGHVTGYDVAGWHGIKPRVKLSK